MLRFSIRLTMRFLAITISSLCLFASCSTATNPKQPVTTATTPQHLVLGGDNEDRAAVLHAMPTPNELFELISGMDSKVDRSALYDIELAKSQGDTLLKAFRFGLCATDLVYATYFDMPGEVVRYYLTTKELSTKLGISEAFDAVDVRRLERNISHGDSLTILSNEAYLTAYEQLDNENKGDLLAAVLAGGWVETTHLLMEQIGEYNESNELLNRLVEQKFGLSQLVDLMELNAGSKEIMELRTQLLSIQDVFDRISVVRLKEEPGQQSGQRVFGGQETFDLSPHKYDEIRHAILALRGVTHDA